MPRLRASRPLDCFYCGKRTGLKFDGSIRKFDCAKCDATNYLDAHGDITDPPVATEREAPASQYTKQKAVSPSSSPADDIFCRTCLKNQHLFTRSLAQYLPSDPSHPDYHQRERDYYRFKKSLEDRYPQVCEDCAVKVDRRIQQAGYTARTDHLRRMMNKSRGHRQPQRRTILDAMNAVGRWLWRGSFVLQLVWHLVIISDALGQTQDGMYDPDDESLWAKSVPYLRSGLALLPSTDKFIRASIITSILSIWWNPHFVQANRGFTRHLVGFTQWYSFQGVTVLSRYVFCVMLQMEGGGSNSKYAQLSVHAAIAAATCLMYVMAIRSIRVDTTPLFVTEKPITPQKQTQTSRRNVPDSKKTFSELMNDALDTPPGTSPDGNKPPASFGNGLSSDPNGRTPSSASLRHNAYYPPPSDFGSSRLEDDTLPNGTNGAVVDNEDAMDWTPTQSQHRAFSNTAPKGNPGFGAAPTSTEMGTFWYKVPQAPMSQARRALNPPNQPVIKRKVSQAATPLFGKKKSTRDGVDAQDPGVAFKQPSFFASAREQDESDSLADMLGRSFSLGPPDQHEADEQTFDTSGQTREETGQVDGKMMSALRPTVFAMLIGLWLVAATTSSTYQMEPRLATLIVAACLSATLIYDTAASTRQHFAATQTGAALGVLNLLVLAWVGWEAVRGLDDVTLHGFGALSILLGHLVWDSLYRAR